MRRRDLTDEQRLSRATEILGHRFRSPTLLLRAITHTSFANEHPCPEGNNELLEFVGDSVLGLVAVDALITASPDAAEGELTERRAAYVSEEALARRADEIGLGHLLRNGGSTSVTVSMRADLVEALIGAVFLDAGFDSAREATLRLLGQPPEFVPDRALSAKKLLQERFQRLFASPPTYEVELANADKLSPRFIARVSFRGAELGTGVARSKKEATEAAAAHAVRVLEQDDTALCARLGIAPRDRAFR